MQTKRKRKQWALLAFTMIATFMVQAIPPLTVNAEEQTYTTHLGTYDCKQILHDDSSHLEWYEDYTITSNIPYKIGVIRHKDENKTEPIFSEDISVLFIFDKSVVSEDMYIKENVICADNCKNDACGHAGGVFNYDFNNLAVVKDESGNTLAYILEKNFMHFDNNPMHDASSPYKYWSRLLSLNNSCISYSRNTDLTDNGTPSVDFTDVVKFVQDIYSGIIPPMNNGHFDESTAIYDTSIPTPNITVKSDYTFGFNNDSEGYYFQLKGRWYSVDDIELYKEKLQWLYKYESIIKSNLTDWVATSEKASTNMQDLNFVTFGKSAFDSFLSNYPIESRSYTGGTNALGNFFNGYNDALSQIKMLLSQPTTFYNGIEIYIRYYTFDENGVAHYGKWCHYYDDLANQDGSNGVIDDYIHNDDKDLHNGYQSEFGVDDDGLHDLENSTNSKNDIDVKPEVDNRYENQIVGVEDLNISNLINSLGNLKEQSSELISMFTTVFSFLPSWLVTLIVCSFGLCCVIGVWKVIRG